MLLCNANQDAWSRGSTVDTTTALCTPTRHKCQIQTRIYSLVVAIMKQGDYMHTIVYGKDVSPWEEEYTGYF
ncbi:hypothetical protein OPQ81_005135 [Rhizoctonia solani]|nr:hypothetical protein OPQ81_005135 [Rhizoctonia solani]